MRGNRYTIILPGAIFLLHALELPQPAVKFTDVTAAAGIHFTHNAGRSGKKWLPETMGSGCAFFDADGDGWLDILLINGKDLVPHGRRTTAALYRNNHNGTFTDITRGSGLDIEIYGMGVAIADYDNDGRDDVYITALGGDHLFHNEGGGHFRDVTEAVRHPQRRLRRQRRMARLRPRRQARPVRRQLRAVERDRTICGARSTARPNPTARRNRTRARRRGSITTWATASSKTSPRRPGWPTPPANRWAWRCSITTATAGPTCSSPTTPSPTSSTATCGNGRFKEEGLTAGVAFGEDGVARGAMGVDAADYDRSGRQHLVVGNFSNQMLGLYHNEGNGLFVDEAPRSPIGRASLLSLTFGLFFFDYDLDGYPDIFAANGHIEEEIGRVQPKIQYAEAAAAVPQHRARKIRAGANAFTRPLVARGAAYGDFDRDGDLDVLVATNNGPAYLYRNDGGNRNHWLQVRLEGTQQQSRRHRRRSARDSAGGTQMQTVHSGSSYCSASDLALTFGLGRDTQAGAIEIQWPSGTRQKLANVKADQRLTIREQ